MQKLSDLSANIDRNRVRNTLKLTKATPEYPNISQTVPYLDVRLYFRALRFYYYFSPAKKQVSSF